VFPGVKMVKYASAAGATPQPPLPGAYSAPQTHSWTKEGNGREKGGDEMRGTENEGKVGNRYVI